MNYEEIIDDLGVCILNEETAFIEYMFRLVVPVIVFSVVSSVILCSLR